MFSDGIGGDVSIGGDVVGGDVSRIADNRLCVVLLVVACVLSAVALYRLHNK